MQILNILNMFLIFLQKYIRKNCFLGYYVMIMLIFEKDLKLNLNILSFMYIFLDSIQKVVLLRCFFIISKYYYFMGENFLIGIFYIYCLNVIIY